MKNTVLQISGNGKNFEATVEEAEEYGFDIDRLDRLFAFEVNYVDSRCRKYRAQLKRR